MRTICIGDIHGCLEEFDMLLKEVAYQKGKDRLILLGDLVDRGPNAAGVVRRAREIGAECLMGNHEEVGLRWRRHEAKRKADPTHYKNPMQAMNETKLAEWAKISDEDWEWLATRPLFLHLDDRWTAVHGGCMPNVPIEEQEPNVLLRMRYIDPIKKKMAAPDERGVMKPGCEHWTTKWRGPRNIIYGHYTYDRIRFTEPSVTGGFGRTVGIDTGCVHGDFLTAYIRHTPPLSLGPVSQVPLYEVANFWDIEGIDDTFLAAQWCSIKAKQVYSVRKPWNEE